MDEASRRPIEGDRVVLSPVVKRDADEMWTVIDSSRKWLDPWLPWVPFQTNLECAQRFAEASELDWSHKRALRFSIRTRSSGQLLGVVGLESCVDMHRSCDLGYWLRREAAGNGYMTEAAALCVDYGFRHLGIHRIRVAAATDNHSSLRVISRLRFRFEGVARQAEWCNGRWLDHAIFGQLQNEWMSAAR